MMVTCSKMLFLRCVSGMVLGTSLGASEADDPASRNPPLSNKVYPVMDLGFKVSSWAKLHPCARPCLSRADVMSRNVPDQELSYEQDFSLSLGQTGPLSFQFSGRRLKMGIEF